MENPAMSRTRLDAYLDSTGHSDPFEEDVADAATAWIQEDELDRLRVEYERTGDVSLLGRIVHLHRNGAGR